MALATWAAPLSRTRWISSEGVDHLVDVFKKADEVDRGVAVDVLG